MTRAPRHKRYDWTPLTMTISEVADRVFRRPVLWVQANLPPDFPKPDPFYGLYAVEAVEAWVRRRWQVVGAGDPREDERAILMERMSAGHRRPVSGKAAP
jgi:hypothetical protein